MCTEKYVLVKQKFIKGLKMGIAVSREGHADSLQGYEKSSYSWFTWKKCYCKQDILIPIALTIFA